MTDDEELTALGPLLDEAVGIARTRIEAIPDGVAVTVEDQEVQEASAVPDAIAARIMSLSAKSAEGAAVKAKAAAWIDGVPSK